jgi:hypothetical protein
MEHHEYYTSVENVDVLINSTKFHHESVVHLLYWDVTMSIWDRHGVGEQEELRILKIRCPKQREEINLPTIQRWSGSIYSVMINDVVISRGKVYP